MHAQLGVRVDGRMRSWAPYLSWANSLAQLAGDTALLPTGIATQGVLTTEPTVGGGNN